MSGPPPNPAPDNFDLSALLSGKEFEEFKSRLAFFLKRTGYNRYELVYYSSSRIVWAKSWEELRLAGEYGVAAEVATGQFRRGDRVVRDELDRV